ncbi:MAG: hypothetical protein NDJ92_02900 [Thermoanaerobaculia bacterium]|nr:hypothetical protein [Thermoanaerobaculia bacterium]
MIRTLFTVVLVSVALPAVSQGQGVIGSDLFSCARQQLQCGNRIDAQLPAGGCMTTCGEWASVWRVQVFAQTTLVTVTASSDVFDPRLDLFDGNSELIESNDGVGGTPNAQITRVLEPGPYFFRVVGQPAGAEGSYRIALTCLLADRENFCVPDDTTLCLRGRFSFRVRATDPRTGSTFVAAPRRQNELYGIFSFPGATGNADNPEVFVKLIDGRSVNGRWWVFWGGLTDLDYAITVRDSFTRREKTYSGHGSDTVSFADP